MADQCFVNAIYLYDDKMVITFNYKDGTKAITLDDVKRAIKKNNTGSDIDCHGAPNKKRGITSLFIWYRGMDSNRPQMQGTKSFTIALQV